MSLPHQNGTQSHGDNGTTTLSATRAGERGFTLVELLVVLVILGLLAGLVGPRVLGYVGGARAKSAAVQMQSLSAALDLYRLDTGTYPTTEQGLAALVERPSGLSGWNGPYLNGATVPLDPWGNPYRYKSPGEAGPFGLFSLGADNREGGDGDDADIGTR